jgi:hypothetical protein
MVVSVSVSSCFRQDMNLGSASEPMQRIDGVRN